MSLVYAEDVDNVNFAVDGPRAFAQTYATQERDKRRTRRADVERRQALKDLEGGSTPAFWSNATGTAGMSASAHPFEQVSASGYSRHQARDIGVDVPTDAAFAVVTKRQSRTGRCSKPEMLPVFGQDSVNVTLLEHEDARVGFSTADGTQLGHLPISFAQASTVRVAGANDDEDDDEDAE